LNLAEAKQMLHNVQRSMAVHQAADCTAQRAKCPHCSRKQPQKGRHEIVFRTLFGKLKLHSLRLYHCGCQTTAAEQTFSPLAELLQERTAPELLYLETKWCALLSFGVTTDLLKEVLPIGEELNPTTIRNNLHRLATRMEAEWARNVSSLSKPVRT
jgi:hypothetical protein